MNRALLCLISVWCCFWCACIDPNGQVDLITLGDGGEDVRPILDGGQPHAGSDGDMPDAEVDPRFNSVMPSRGPINEETSVRIVGLGFSEGMTVHFGDKLAQNVTVESTSLLRCSAPAVSEAGTVRVTVRWPDGDAVALENAFTYFIPISVNSISPTEGPTKGGTSIRISGTGLNEPTSVRIGSANASSVKYVKETGELTAVTPPGNAGSVDVSLQNINGLVQLPNAFTYTETLALSGVQPRYGSTAGGDEIKLFGLGLSGNSTIAFESDYAEALGEVVASELERTVLRVKTPAHRAGLVSIRAQNANGVGRLDDAFLFVDTSLTGFQVVQAVPSRLPMQGGVEFVVAGAGFDETVRVFVDGHEISCSGVSRNILVCSSPIHELGAADLTVENQDGEEVRLSGGLWFYEEVEIYSIEPDHGSIGGGTEVLLNGRGFTEDMTFELDGVPLDNVRVQDNFTAVAVTPPGMLGFVDLVAKGETMATLPEAYRYMDPFTRYGGIFGERAAWSINVSVRNYYNGKPVEEAQVFGRDLNGNEYRCVTNQSGLCTLSHLEMTPPVDVTATKSKFSVFTYEKVTAENLTIFLMPDEREPQQVSPDDDDQDIDIEPRPTEAYLKGHLTGLNDLPKPLEPGMVLVALLETSHTSLYNRNYQPYPGSGAILYEDGPFEIVSRGGEMALVATAGYLPVDEIRRFESLTDSSQRNYNWWQLRSLMTPLAMGLKHYITVSLGDTLDGISLSLDVPTNLMIPITLDNPPGGVEGAPEAYTVRYYMDLGVEGYLEWPTITGDSPSMMLRYLPDVALFGRDVRWFFMATAHPMAGSYSVPYSDCLMSAKSLSEDGLKIGPFVGTVDILNPGPGDSFGDVREVIWQPHPGITGRPTEPPDVTLISLYANGRTVWEVYAPGPVTSHPLPELPSDIVPGLFLAEGVYMYMSVTPILAFEGFTFENFRWSDLNTLNRRSYSVQYRYFYGDQPVSSEENPE